MYTRQSTISNSEGIACGELSAAFYQSPEDLSNAATLRIVKLAAPEGWLWPLAILRSIEVSPAFRGKGVGTAALKSFIDEARNLAIKLVFSEWVISAAAPIPVERTPVVWRLGTRETDFAQSLQMAC